MKTSLIIPAAGIGTRMNFPVAKQFYELYDMPIILHLLKRVEMVGGISEVIVALRDQGIESFNGIVSGADLKKPIKTVTGGNTRQESVHAALSMVSPECGLVMVHDAVRPLVTPNMMIDAIEKTKELKATVAAVKVKDTIKEVRDGVVVRTLDRSGLFSIQTPQTFYTDIIKAAHENALREGIKGTDDAALVEADGGEVHVIPGSYDNIKITTCDDLAMCENILKLQKSSLNYY